MAREANKALAILKEQGVSAVKVDVDVEELIQWCAEKGMKVDSSARAEFAVRKMHQPKPKEWPS